MTLKSKQLLNFPATLEQLLGVLSSNFCWIYLHNLFIPRCARTPPPKGPRGPLFLLTPSHLSHSFTRSIFSRGLWISFLVLCSQTKRKRLIRRLLQKKLMGFFQLQGVDLGSFFSWRRIRYALFLFCVALCLKYQLFSVAKNSIRGTRKALFTG